DAIAAAPPPAAAGKMGMARLVPLAKAHPRLTDNEIRHGDALIPRPAPGKFGPGRSVRPSPGFQLGFVGSPASQRHQSGISVRCPRILRMRTDKPLRDADTLQRLLALLGQ